MSEEGQIVEYQACPKHPRVMLPVTVKFICYECAQEKRAATYLEQKRTNIPVPIVQLKLPL